VRIQSQRGGHYEHRVQAESSLQAAAIALEQHEELARAGKLKDQTCHRGQITSLIRPSLIPFFTALREQLGLNLEAQKSQVEYIVVDRIERLIPN
jgi:uncharacterized protein (TIGR03435 family)